MPTFFVRLLALAFLSQVGFAAALPVMPLFLRAHGLPVAWMGYYTAAYAVPSVLLRGAAGRLSDVAGRRPLVVAGLLVEAVAFALFALPLPVAAYLAARAMGGAGAALVGPALAALAGESAAESHRGRVFGALNSAGTAGYILGPAAGGLLAGRVGPEALFLVSAAAFFAGTLVALPLPSAAPGRRTPRQPADRRRMVRLARHLWPLLLLNAAWMGANGVNDAVWVLYLHGLGASQLLIGLAFAAFGVPLLVLPYLFGRLADRIGRHHALIVAGVMADAALFLLYALVGRPWEAIAVSLAEAAAVSLLLPAYGAALTRAAPPFGQGEAQGLSSAVGNASLFATAVLGGYLFSWRRGAPFVLVAAMLAAAGGLSSLPGGRRAAAAGAQG